MQTKILEFKYEEASDPVLRLVCNCGLFDDTEGLDEHEIYIDNVSLEMIDDSNAVKAEVVEVPSKDVNVNQIGYLPGTKKTAIFRGDTKGDSFEIINVENNETVYTGKIENEKMNSTAGETNYYGDFTEVAEAGTYKIKTEAYGEFYEFKIGEDVYDNVFADTVKMLHKQRCGIKLDPSIAGEFTGGPDSKLEDPYAAAMLKDTPAAKCYVDNHGSFSTNEITIYWNSPFIFTMNALK
ncbi:cellulase N-terminal Ig-like domain-containing protein [[Clostridium] polysaccharolyticum]|uniref:Endoglucanase n=1 Tax=[Clostridium] polysaccharolyticum TaxID=29364 RepID=A0A1I0BWL6_9FIRM|nr:cellulase N-terminal Ig-like domain-containing protein [[Clostridium] polysaccharolyticum]SET11471.1 Glycosyl hydrolase family 9 [[Clostridium] polysaccharolyticum]